MITKIVLWYFAIGLVFTALDCMLCDTATKKLMTEDVKEDLSYFVEDPEEVTDICKDYLNTLNTEPEWRKVIRICYNVITWPRTAKAIIDAILVGLRAIMYGKKL